MHTRRSIIAVSLALVGLLAYGTAEAQTSTSGAILGRVLDSASGQPLAGVTVVASSPALQGTQSAFTDSTGQYRITTLPPGTYTISFFYADVQVQRTNVIVSINTTTPVHVRLDTADATGEVIVVEDRAPQIDPTRTTQGITLTQDYTRNIPIPGRTFESALGAAPGSAGDDLGVSFSGSTSLENQYVVDGVNTTGLTYGTVGSPLINDFIQEIEIITGGYNAEFGRSTGGVVNVVTKSGSNEFHGTVFSYFTPGFLVATRERTPVQSSSIDAESNLAFDTDFGFDLGGPIIKDKVWFYVGFAPRLQRLNVDRITKRRTDCRTVLPDGTLSDCDPMAYRDGVPDEDPETGFLIFEELDRQRLKRDQTVYQFLSKINFALAPEHQGQVSLIGIPISGETVGVYGVPHATRFDYTQLTTDLAAKWTSKFNDNKTEVEAVFGWHRSSFEADSIDNFYNDVPGERLLFGDLATWGRLGHESMATVQGCTNSAAAGDPYPLITNCPDEGFGYRVGGPGGIADQLEQRFSARLSGTQRVNAFGNHEIKGGVDVEDNYLNKVRHISGGWFANVYLSPYNETHVLRWVQLAPEGNPDGFGETCRDTGRDQEFACQHLGPTDVKGRTINWSAYLRDSWQIMPNLTFNAGMRYEEQRLRYAKALQGTDDPFTGEYRGTNAMTMNHMWAPRLGLLYDWTKEGRSKVYGHWGRFYQSIPMNINDRSFGGETFYYQLYDAGQCGAAVDGYGGPGGQGCVDSGLPPTYGERIFGSGVLIAPGIRPQYMDEAIMGVEYEVLEDLKLGLSIQNRRMGRILEDVSVDNAETYIIANPGEWPQREEDKLVRERDAAMGAGDDDEVARLDNLLEQYRGIRGFDKARRDYNAVQLTATKRFSRQFFVQSSYTYSTTRGNYPGLYSPDNMQVDPNISSQFDLIELLANRDGPLPQDRPHYFKFDGYYIFDFKRAGQLTTGARFRALSGTPVNALGRHHLYGINEAFLLPRGAMGRTSFETGLDLKVAYGRQLRRGMTLEVFTDLFNVFNSQGVFRVDNAYTYDRANPVVGGDFEDLIWLKAQNTSGGETNTPVRRNLNFQNPSVRYSPFSARLGARLTF